MLGFRKIRSTFYPGTTKLMLYKMIFYDVHLVLSEAFLQNIVPSAEDLGTKNKSHNQYLLCLISRISHLRNKYGYSTMKIFPEFCNQKCLKYSRHQNSIYK